MIAVGIVLSLACYRIVRLIIDDTITDPIRKFTVYRMTGRLRELFGCYWCLSIWVAAGLVFAYWAAPVVTLWVGGALAVSTIVGLIASNSK